MNTTIRDAWYVFCSSRDLTARSVVARTVFGRRFVAFRGPDGEPGVIRDRCVHRGMPLSEGTLQDGLLRCPYHGWRFDRRGACQEIPLRGSRADRDLSRHRVEHLAVHEAAGWLWVHPAPDRPVPAPPLRFEPPERSVRFEAPRVVLPGSFVEVVENFTDDAHNHVLHRGLTRGATASRAGMLVVYHTVRGARAEYRGPRPPRCPGSRPPAWC